MNNQSTGGGICFANISPDYTQAAWPPSPVEPRFPPTPCPPGQRGVLLSGLGDTMDGTETLWMVKTLTADGERWHGEILVTPGELYTSEKFTLIADSIEWTGSMIRIIFPPCKLIFDAETVAICNCERAAYKITITKYADEAGNLLKIGDIT